MSTERAEQVSGSASPPTAAPSASVDWTTRLHRAFGDVTRAMEPCGRGRFLTSPAR